MNQSDAPVVSIVRCPSYDSANALAGPVARACDLVGGLGGKRAEYGAQVIQKLSAWLTQAYGRGWSAQQLRHCRHLAHIFEHDEIFSALRRELSWTNIKTIMYIDDPLKREFYIEMCKMNNWDLRTLQGLVKSMLFERTAISRKPDETIAHDLEELRKTGRVSEDLVFRDPYLLDYLSLRDSYSERDLESAILVELQQSCRCSTRRGRSSPCGSTRCRSRPTATYARAAGRYRQAARACGDVLSGRVGCTFRFSRCVSCRPL